MKKHDDRALWPDEEWNPRALPPEGVRFDNLRKRGVDSVRVGLSSTVSAFDPKLDLPLPVAMVLGLVLKPGPIMFAIVAVVAVLLGAYFFYRRRLVETWDISITSDSLAIAKGTSGNGPKQTWNLCFSEIEHISIASGRRGASATVNITTNRATISIGAGQPEATLIWLKNYLILELVGLTWRPLHGIDRRHSRARDSLVTNPLLLKPDLAIRLIDIFSDEAPGVIRQLAAAIADKDAEGVRQNAHWLKSSSANVGARHMSELCQLMESYGKEKDFEHTDVLFREIERKCVEVIDWLKEIRNSAANNIAYLPDDEDLSSSPVEPAEANDLETGQSEESQESEKLPELIEARILVVDDSSVSREIARDFLEEIVTEVVFANDGIAALDLLNKSKFDLILMDCEMYGLNGYNCTRRWRKQEAMNGAGRIPIIATTAHALKGDRARCIDAGMDDYLSKPFSPESLFDKIVQWLRVARLDQDPMMGTPADEAGTGEQDPEKPRPAVGDVALV